jgi:uncharacterized lipoprotein YmbA
MKTRSRLLLSLCLGSLLLGAAGCGLKKKAPDVHRYALDAVAADAAAPVREGPVLQVRKVIVSPPFGGSEIVYRTSDVSYESDFYSRFVAPPGDLLTDEIRDWLSGAGLFRRVVDFGLATEATHTLEGRIHALYGDYREKGNPRAVLEVEFTLLRRPPTQNAVIFHRAYRQGVAFPAGSAEELVRGWNAGLEKILTELTGDLTSLDLSRGAGETSR